MRIETRRIAAVFSIVTIISGRGGAQSRDERPFIGLQLQPVPDLLVKHLRLEPGQGALISNVAKATPADRVGLERDDVVIGFRGEPIEGSEEFVRAVRATEVGTEVSLEVIQRGRRKTVTFEMESLGGAPEWKYESEPAPVLSWRPGRLYKIGPEGQEWVEIPFDGLPQMDLDVPRFFEEVHTYHHVTDGEQYTVTIRGNPSDEGSEVVVESGDAEHRTTVGRIDSLPARYREAAEKAVRQARRRGDDTGSTQPRFHLPEPPNPDIYRRYLERLPRPNLERWSQRRDRAIERIESQMEQLRQQMKELEQRNHELLDRLLDRDARDEESQEAEGPAPEDPGDSQTI
jgi:hypothetical protein